MSESAPKGSIVIGFLGLVCASVVGFAEGLRILRGGTLDVHSGNYRQTLAFVDLMNLVLRRPQQRGLSQGQIRAYGIAGIVVGLTSAIGAAYALYTLLH